MMKLIKISLITAMLVPSAMADGGKNLPKTIEAGATVTLNSTAVFCDSDVINNYGTIQASTQKVTIYGSGEIINHDGQELSEVEESSSILAANSITGVTTAYEVGLGTAVFDSENITVSGVTITNTSETGCDFSGLGATDIVYLEADSEGQTVSIQGGASTATQKTIACHFGDQGAEQSYDLSLSGSLKFTGTFSNYTGGKIKVPDLSAGSKIQFTATEFNVPFTSSNQSNYLTLEVRDAVINKNFTVGSGTEIYFEGDSILKSGATLTIG